MKSVLKRSMSIVLALVFALSISFWTSARPIEATTTVACAQFGCSYRPWSLRNGLHFRDCTREKCLTFNSHPPRWTDYRPGTQYCSTCSRWWPI